MTVDQNTLALRRLVFEVAVRHDVDVCPASAGAVLTGPATVTVGWDAVRSAAGEGPHAHRRLATFLRTVRALAGCDEDAFARRLRPVGMPVGSPLHPGSDWCATPVMGRALDLGVGVLGLLDDPDRVDVVTPEALSTVGLAATGHWPAALRYLEDMGEVAAQRLQTSPAPPSSRHPVLRPMGDADVVTLLGSAAYREALAAHDGSGMCAVAVPMRRRGWLDLRALDPAFVPAAAAATDAQQRGFTKPVLVTADEVVLPD